MLMNGKLCLFALLRDNIVYFSIKTCVVVTHFLRITYRSSNSNDCHKIAFYGKLLKIMFSLSLLAQETV